MTPRPLPAAMPRTSCLVRGQWPVRRPNRGVEKLDRDVEQMKRESTTRTRPAHERSFRSERRPQMLRPKLTAGDCKGGKGGAGRSTRSGTGPADAVFINAAAQQTHAKTSPDSTP